MSRSVSFIGLNHIADEFIEKNGKREESNFCKHCGKANSFASDCYESEEVIDMMYQKIPLMVFNLKDGRIAKEIEQKEVGFWASGPFVFTCLEVDGERIAKWDRIMILNETGEDIGSEGYRNSESGKWLNYKDVDSDVFKGEVDFAKDMYYKWKIYQDSISGFWIAKAVDEENINYGGTKVGAYTKEELIDKIKNY